MIPETKNKEQKTLQLTEKLSKKKKLQNMPVKLKNYKLNIQENLLKIQKKKKKQ